MGFCSAAYLFAAAYLVLVERWIAAWVQDRLGPKSGGDSTDPNSAFCWLGQPIADGVKFICKEEFTPGHVDRALYSLAPVVMLTAALAAFGLFRLEACCRPIPLAEDKTYQIHLMLLPWLDAGILFFMAVEDWSLRSCSWVPGRATTNTAFSAECAPPN